MAFSSDQLNEAIAVAHRAIMKEVPSQLEVANYLWYCLTRPENRKKVSGGTSIQQPIKFKRNQSKGFINGQFDTIDTNANQQITFANFDWKYYYSNCSITLDDLVKTHQTPNAIADLLEAKKEGALEDAVADLSEAMHGSGSDSNGKAFNGFTDIFAASGTSYGGLTDTDFPTSDGWLTERDTTSSTPNYATISRLITKLKARGGQYGMKGKNGEKMSSYRPDIMISNYAVQDKFMGTLQAQQRFGDAEKLKAGFDGVEVNNLFWYIDDYTSGSADGSTGDNYLYIISSKSMQFCYKYGFDSPSPMDQIIQLPNQTVKSDQVYLCGNLTTKVRRVNGVFTALVA